MRALGIRHNFLPGLHWSNDKTRPAKDAGLQAANEEQLVRRIASVRRTRSDAVDGVAEHTTVVLTRGSDVKRKAPMSGNKFTWDDAG